MGFIAYYFSPVHTHLDHKIYKHFRNYNTTLNQRKRFNTQEEFYEFLGHVFQGIKTLHKIDY